MRVVPALLLALTLTACGDSPSSSPSVAADCSLAIRVDDTVYVEAGFVRAPAHPAGRADSSSCDDTSEDARGAYFRSDPDQVDVVSFDGQDPAVVLGVLESGERYRVFVADEEDASEVLRQLRDRP